MAKTKQEQLQPAPEITAEELEAEQVNELPNREAMSVVIANLALPMNAAAGGAAAGGKAIAQAVQDVAVEQTG